MKELKEFTVERLEEISSRALVSMDEASALAKIALAAKQANPDYLIHAVEVCDSYGPDIELRAFNSTLEASKCKDDHGGEIIPVYTTPPLNHTEHHLDMVVHEGWIKCSDRMPEDSQWCAVRAEYGYYIQCWGSEQGWLGDEISIPNCDVTHWVPLPAAPKPEM